MFFTAREAFSETAASPEGRYTPKGIAVRLFLTCWLIYALHFATNIVREVYLALAIGDHLSFRVDEYAHLHPDLFEKKGYGWHIGNNPGASMLAAIPYAAARPVIDFVVKQVNRSRAASGQTQPPVYNSPWPLARKFYQEAWRRGLDVKFGLAALIMQWGCMAPVSALGAVLMFYLLRCLFGSGNAALWLALLYAFGTPVFFRTGYLNQNLLLGHIAFLGFIVLWNPGGSTRWTARTRYFLAGLAGGMALLCDYSGALLLVGLFLYGLLKCHGDTLRRARWYILGTLGPVFLLWFYQWQSFGNPFLPGQHWMPSIEWIDRGYQGVSGPQPELALALAFDYRFGLFASCPFFLLALLSPLFERSAGQRLPRLELAFTLSIFVAFWLFFSGVSYTRLQFNTGVRYLAPVFPFLFVPAAAVLMRLPRVAIYFAALISVAQAWCMAMCRDVERGLGVLEPILHVFLGGFQLPALTVLSRMGDRFGEYFAYGASPLPLFALAAAVICGLWTPRFWSFGLRRFSKAEEP